MNHYHSLVTIEEKIIPGGFYAQGIQMPVPYWYHLLHGMNRNECKGYVYHMDQNVIYICCVIVVG